MSEGDVGLAVAIVAGGIEDKGVALCVAGGVAAPEVAVEEGRVGGVIGEEGGDVVEEFVGPRKGFAALGGELQE